MHKHQARSWVAEITYVRALSGFAYTPFVVDDFSRKSIGVATRSTMRTDALPMEALEHALTTAARIHGDQLAHHSDRSSQYMSLKYSAALGGRPTPVCTLLAHVGAEGDAVFYPTGTAHKVLGGLRGWGGDKPREVRAKVVKRFLNDGGRHHVDA